MELKDLIREYKEKTGVNDSEIARRGVYSGLCVCVALFAHSYKPTCPRGQSRLIGSRQATLGRLAGASRIHVRHRRHRLSRTR